MTAQDHLSSTQFVRPITKSEARGNSRPVSHAEFQDLARRGHERLSALSADTARGSTRGLDRNWHQIKEHAWQESQKPWGGVTVHAATGVPLVGNEDRYALTVRQPGQPTVSVPENASREQFHGAMDEARKSYPQLAHADHYLGVFHDDDEKRIDVDPIVVVNSPREVEEIGAYSHAVGGAYHFKSGNGYFPPHVEGSGR